MLQWAQEETGVMRAAKRFQEEVELRERVVPMLEDLSVTLSRPPDTALVLFNLSNMGGVPDILYVHGDMIADMAPRFAAQQKEAKEVDGEVWNDWNKKVVFGPREVDTDEMMDEYEEQAGRITSLISKNTSISNVNLVKIITTDEGE